MDSFISRTSLFFSSAAFFAPHVFVLSEIIVYNIFYFLYSKNIIKCMPDSLVTFTIPSLFSLIFIIIMIINNVHLSLELEILEGITILPIFFIWFCMLCSIKGIGHSVPLCTT